MKQTSEIILDSMLGGVRVTTFRYEIWRSLHAELLTYRRCARCASSSRAVPFLVNLKRVQEDPFVPNFIGREHTGMSPKEYMEGQELYWAQQSIKSMASHACSMCQWLMTRRVAKSILNRYLEPFNTINVLMTGATHHWEHLFAQRTSEFAEPNLRELVLMMQQQYQESIPVQRTQHMPFWTEDLEGNPRAPEICAARVARLSYCQHGTPVMNTAKDVELAERLRKDGHLSPFEAVVFQSKFPRGANAIDEDVTTLRQLMELETRQLIELDR